MKYNRDIPRNIKQFTSQCEDITDIKTIPNSTGLYKLIINDLYIYIGRAKDLQKRYNEYLDIINPDITLHELNQRLYFECKYTGNLARLYYNVDISKIEFRYFELEDSTNWNNRDSFEYAQKLYEEEMIEAELTAIYMDSSELILLNYSLRRPEQILPVCPLKYDHWVIGSNDTFKLPNGNGNKYTSWTNQFIYFNSEGKIAWDITLGRPRPHQVLDVIDTINKCNEYQKLQGKDAINLDWDIDFI